MTLAKAHAAPPGSDDPGTSAVGYRDQEGLTIAEIARRLGRAESTVTAYLYDPLGEKAREVKARYRGVCPGCGAPTSARNGRATRMPIASAAVPGDREAMDPRAEP